MTLNYLRIYELVLRSATDDRKNDAHFGYFLHQKQAELEQTNQRRFYPQRRLEIQELNVDTTEPFLNRLDDNKR